MQHIKNFLSKREQSQARLRFAECEKSRLKAKIIMTLALLLTAVTGAWADESETITTATKNTTVYTGTHFKITASYICDANGIYLFSNNNHGTATIESLNGENITKIEMHMTNGGRKAIKTTTTEGQLEATNGTEDTNDISVIYVNATSVQIGTTVEAIDGTDVQIDKFVIYYGAATFPFPITWDATNKTTGFNLPAGNVFMNVEYYPAAALTAAPAAKSDIKATTDDAIVTAGTVAKIGQTENAQGTLMYYAVQSETVPDAPDYDNQGWSDKVPTAAAFKQGNVYVWYYVKGADGDAESTFNDGAITKLGESGYVTLAAAPTYAITLAEGTEEAGKWTISPAEAAAGSPVTATYSGTKKVKSVKAVKKADNTYLKWDADQKKLVATDILTTANKVQDSNENIEWAGTYVVEEDVTISGEIKLTGDVELIIKDGVKLTVNKIIHTQSGASLSVYGQTQMSGELNVTNQGSDAIFALNSFAVHSCKVKATSPAGQGGGVYNATIVNVYGGSLDAECTGSYGHGIQLRTGGSMNIYGGEVKAIGKGNNADYSYGIKSSNNSTGVATVTVYGGKLWTECAGNKALSSVITLTKGDDFAGKIETSGNGDEWTPWESGTPETKYVRVGY